MQLRRHKLDFPGGQFWIGFLALEDLAFHGDDEFAARLLGFGMRRRLCLFVKDHLHHAGAVAHIEKEQIDRKSTRLNSSHRCNSYTVSCLKKKRIGRWEVRLRPLRPYRGGPRPSRLSRRRHPHLPPPLPPPAS